PVESTIMVCTGLDPIVNTFVTAPETNSVLTSLELVKSAKDTGSDLGANDIALDFNDEINKLYGSRHLDNLPHPGQQYSQQAHDGNISTCSSTDSASPRINRRNEPYWSIYFINNTRFYDFQLVLSNDETLR
ncbi:hypothetical protein MAR_022604, partial [Mya arenaria]